MIFIVTLLSLLPLTISHFTLDSPAARGFDEDQVGTFPCGGQDTVSEQRTPFPLNGGPIQLSMEHDESAVQVLLGMGNNPGDAFNTVLVRTIQERGIGQFCMSDVVLPSNMGIMEGDNATIQVVTNGDPTGGLYNCADITFTTQPNPDLSCNNGSEVEATAYTGRSANANGTGEATPASSGSPSGSMSGSASAATPSSTGSASSTEMCGLLLLAGAVIAAMGIF